LGQAKNQTSTKFKYSIILHSAKSQAIRDPLFVSDLTLHKDLGIKSIEEAAPFYKRFF